MNKFSGKTCVVTGGGSGIGKALSELLLEHGATVHAFDINADGLDSLEAGAGQLHRARIDVTNEREVSEQLSVVVEESGTLDYLFNVAGITIAGEARGP